MRLSALLFRTLKQAPSDADIPSHQLLERGGYIHKLGRGLYVYSPLMWRVLKKLQNIIREEMDREGAQEVCFPQLHPEKLWNESGRWDDYISEGLLYTLKDRDDHDYCLAPTAEEVAVDFVSSWKKSYKDLPLNIYQFGNKFRDEIRPRFGLMRGKEFFMKDGYSFSTNAGMMDEHYEQMKRGYCAVFDRLGLTYVLVEAHGGKIASTGRSQEFQVTAEVGEDLVMVCGDHASNVEATVSIAPTFDYATKHEPKEKIDTPDATTIEKLSTSTKTPPQLILKTLIYKLEAEKYAAIAIRGDRQVNQLKVEAKLGVTDITLATDDEIKRLTGARAGFIGPLDLSIPLYADNTTKPMTNFMCASNENDTHYKNVNWGCDIPTPEFCDFLLAEEGDGCPHIEGGIYKIQRGIEVGHIFNIGTKYSDKLNAHFQDEGGDMQPFWMGTYGIGLGRTAQACVEQTHDERGIIWPLAIAPYKILITAAVTKNPDLVEQAERLYRELAPFEPLLDDREERLGFKLKDADLIGIPYKLIVGKTFTNEGKFEIESRQGEKVLIAKEQLLEWAKSTLHD